MARMQILFSGFADLAEQIDKVNGDLHKAVDEALSDTQKIVSEAVTSSALPYRDKGIKGYATGEMFSTIRNDAKPYWKGTVAEIGVGFGADKSFAGFMHSIYIMYGTPKMPKNVKVYNAIRGTRVRKEIAKQQEEVLRKYVTL